jgi:pyrroloquinoline quinone (PQQ) biosynthesis protein C
MAVLDNNSIVEAVENIISKNKALDNAFFRKCENEPISKEKLKEFVINFYPITEAFALNSFAYCNTISEEIHKRSEIENGVIANKNLETFLSKIIEVTMVEFNINNDKKPSNFHFNAFSRLAPKLGINIDDLKNKKYQLNQETKELVENLKRNFQKKNLLSGLANVFVIEYTALNIINCLWNAFAKLKDESGNDLYTSYELEHITLHQVLEIEHNEEAHDLLNLLVPSHTTKTELTLFADELSTNLGNYWTKLLEIQQ